MYKCNLCGEEKDIVLWEYLGACGGWLKMKCNSCGKEFAKNGLEILAETQPKKYGPVYFILKGKEENLRYINQFHYTRPTIEEDKIFEELEKNLFFN